MGEKFRWVAVLAIASALTSACAGDGDDSAATVEREVTTTVAPATTTTQVPSQPSGREAVCDRFDAEIEKLQPDEPFADLLRHMAGFARGAGDDEWAEVAERLVANEEEREAIRENPTEGFSDEARNSADAFRRDLEQQTERLQGLNERSEQLMGELVVLCAPPVLRGAG
jgi:hypothetical protein